MTTIKAPFNFVPISDYVYFPEWRSMISFDKPFKDSCSGMIELEIKSETPIYIRNGHTPKEKEEAMNFAKKIYHSIEQEIAGEIIEEEINEKLTKPNKEKKKLNKEEAIKAIIKDKISDEDNPKWRKKIIELLNKEPNSYSYFDFSNMDNTYFIPGSSLKGCFRNVLEILSFGKFRISKNYTPKTIANINFHDKISKSHNSKEFDLSDCIFGSVNKDNSLKGRVQISNAYCTNRNEVTNCNFIMSAMGSPKPSYYPIYLEQEKVKGLSKVESYTDYTQDFSLKGRKRYPIHSMYIEPDICTFENASKMVEQATIFRPIKNAKFKCKIRFFNLNSEEFGALLSSITFHNQQECKHNIGLGKALGLGGINIHIKNIIVNNKKINEQERINYINKFESLMTEEFDEKWEKSQPLKELFEMAKGKGKQSLSYMKLSEHKSAEEQNEFLDLFSFIKNNKHEYFYIIQKKEIRKSEETNLISLDSLVERGENEIKFPQLDISNIQIGDVITVHCHSNKKVSINELDNIQLVIPKELSANSYIGETFKVRVSQINKDGEICQVKII